MQDENEILYPKPIEGSVFDLRRQKNIQNVQEYIEICLLQIIAGQEPDYDCESFFKNEPTYVVESSDFRPIN